MVDILNEEERKAINASPSFRQKRSIFYDLLHDVQPILCGHFSLPYGYGIRVYFFFFLRTAETFFS